MRPLTLVSLVTILATVGCPPSLHAQQWLEPFDTLGVSRSTMGGYLERHFGRVMHSCGIPKLTALIPRRFRDDAERALTSIPQVLQGGALRLPAQVRDQETDAPARLFAYVYRPAEVGSAGRMQTDRLLRLSLNSDPVSMLPQGSSSIVYTNSCNSVVNAAASVGFSPPLPTLKAALAAEYGNSKSTWLALVEGQFQSPIVQMLNDPDPRTKLLAQLTIWDWYRRNPRDADAPAFLLTKFSGAALFYLLKQQRDQSGRLDLGVGGGTPIASASASLQMALTNRETSEIQQYSTAFYLSAGKPQIDSTPLIRPAEIAGYVNKQGYAELDHQQMDRVVVSAHGHLHSQIIEGMPRDLCDPSIWTISPASSSDGTLTLTSVAMDQPRRCRFTVSYAADTRLFAAGTTGSVTLNYAFVSNDAIGASKVALRFPAAQVPLATSLSPRLVPIQGDPMYSRQTIKNGAGEVLRDDLSWQTSFSVDERGTPIDWAQGATSTSFQLLCGGANIPVSVTVATQNVTPRVLNISLQHAVFPSDSLDLSGSGERCNLTGTLGLTLQATSAHPLQPVDRPIAPTILVFPKHVAALAPK